MATTKKHKNASGEAEHTANESKTAASGEADTTNSGASSAAGSANTSSAGAGQGRVIKKYPNRRLYDMANSAYITLADVKQLVMQREPVVVVDAKTGENLTRSILLQIILEEEVGGTPLFSESVLANLIRFYGHTMQGFLGAYMERNILAMAEMQSQLQSQWAEQARHISPDFWSQFPSMSSMSPMSPMSPNVVGAPQNLLKMQEQMQQQIQQQVRQQTEQFLQMFGLKPREDAQ